MTRPRVLVFSSLLPLPIDRGDRNRLFHILHLLTKSADVRLVAVDRDWEPAVRDVAPLAPVDVHSIRVSAREVTVRGLWSAATGRPFLITRYALPRIQRFVREQARQFEPDVLWGYQAPSLPFLGDAGRARTIIDLVDSPSRYVGMTRENREIAWSARLAMAVQWRIASYERQAVASCDTTIVNSRADLEYVRALTGRSERVIVLDNCVPASFMARPWTFDARRPPQLLFVGNLAYAPNETAVRLTVNEILPRIRARMPEASLVVCGARGEALARELGGRPGVMFRGFVDDLVPVYLSSSVMLVPVPLAGGTQYKLLESLAIGLPAVVSRVSAEVTGIEHGRQGLVADTPDDYAEAALTLLSDGTLASRLSAAGRSLIEAEHTWESKAGLVAGLVMGDATPA